jgi:hypothetical protein
VGVSYTLEPGIRGRGLMGACRKWKRVAMVHSARYSKNGITPFSGNHRALSYRWELTPDNR